MKYTGDICTGCGLIFTEQDDVVVCPDCGTPQHRHCYEKENRCVVSEKHQSDYIWQGINKPAAKVAEKETELFPCPSCGHENPKGSQQCENCGMKFVMFGMNMVDALHEKEKKETSKSSIPDYKAPFTLGVGEGFDNQEQINQGEKIADEILYAFQGKERNEDGSFNFPGPFPQSDKIGGVKTNTVGNLIGANGMKYISKFKKLESGKSISFNFAALIFSPYWFFYRKLYMAGVFFTTAFLALSIIFTPSILDFAESYLALIPTTQEAIMAMSEAELTEIMNILYPKAVPFAVYLGIFFGLKLIIGFAATPLYKKHVLKNAAAAEKAADRKAATTIVGRDGGASLLLGLSSFFAIELLSLIISYVLG